MRRPCAILIASALLAAACNPPAPGTAAAPEDSPSSGASLGGIAGGSSDLTAGRQSVSDRNAGATIGEAAQAVSASLDQKPEAVWASIKNVYDALKIPVTVANPVTHQIGNAKFYATHRLADSLMSTWLDCGNGQTGLRANSDRIYMTLFTTVKPNGKGGTDLATLFSAQSLDVSGGASDMQQCISKGRLELMINEMARKITPITPK